MKYESLSEKIFSKINIVFFTIASFTFAYPFINILAISLNNADDSNLGGIYFWPRIFTLDSYRFIFKAQNILSATQISIARTLIGTLLVVLCSSMFAYVFTQPQYMFYKQLKFIFFLAMFFGGGGLIPTYLLYRNLGLLNRFWVYIVPSMLSLWYTVLFRTYMQGLPKGLEEAAKIDGANELRIYLQIILPLITPIIAYISLMAAVGQWNSWTDTLYFTSHKNLRPLQFLMMEILTAAQTTIAELDPREIEEKMQTTASPYSVRMAITIVATVPILVVYPFLQKYFIKGIVVGSMKG